MPRFRSSTSVALGCLAAGVLLLSGCASAAGPAGAPSDGAASAGPSSPAGVTPSARVSATSVPGACAPVPVSTGPARAVATLVLTAPGSAAGGSTIAVSASLQAAGDGTRIVTDSARSDVLIIADGVVVGRAGGLRDTLAVPLSLQAGVRAVLAVPSHLRMAGCGGTTGTSLTGPALPAGSYQLVAVLGYSSDALYSGVDGGVTANAASGGGADSGSPPAGRTLGPGGSRAFVLVSQPVPITVR